MSDATVFVSIAFAIVWMQRQKRWTRFFQALEGTVSLQTSGSTTTTPTSTTTSK